MQPRNRESSSDEDLVEAMAVTGAAVAVTATETVPLSELRPYRNNPRQGNVAAIVASLQAHGQYRALVVNRRTNEVLAGNHTLSALRQLGAETALVHFVDVEDDQAARLVLADNRTSDLASYDDAALLELLEAVPSLEGTGYDADYLDDLLRRLNPPQRTSGDTPPGALPSETRTQLGDLWLLGDHRLICGDATDASVVSRVLGEARPDLLVTDPPYGVSYASIGREMAARRELHAKSHARTKQHAPIAGDSLSPEATRDVCAAALSVAGLRPGGSFYLTVPSGPMLRWFIEAVEAGLGPEALRQCLVWMKNALVMGRSDYHYRHETILYGWEPSGAHYFIDDRKQDSVWEIDRPSRSTEHPTMKPVELFERAIANSSREGEMVYDPFAGSGTAVIACENLGRAARVVELEPAYCDVIVDRWERHTGLTAVLEAPDGA